jgi:hypothetical protein
MSSEDLVPIPLKPRVDPEKAPHISFSIKHKNMEVTNHATGLTCCMTTDLETILATIAEIKDVLGANRLNITQGPLCFQYAREFFGGNACRAWDLAILGLARTVANLQVAFANLVKQLVSTEAYSDQRTYMQSLKKPTEMTVQQFIACILQMQELMSHLPRQDQEPMMTEHEFKYIVFNVHPRSFCDQYTLKYNDSMHAITLTTMGDRLARIQRVMDQKPSGSEQPSKKQKSNSSGSTSGNRNNVRSNNNNRNPGGEKKGAACCIPGHSGHLWKECRANKHSPNYDKDFVPKAWAQDGKATTKAVSLRTTAS